MELLGWVLPEEKSDSMAVMQKWLLGKSCARKEVNLSMLAHECYTKEVKRVVEWCGSEVLSRYSWLGVRYSEQVYHRLPLWGNPGPPLGVSHPSPQKDRPCLVSQFWWDQTSLDHLGQGSALLGKFNMESRWQFLEKGAVNIQRELCQLPLFYCNNIPRLFCFNFPN